MKMPHQSGYEIWRWPVVLAALTMVGLLSALLGQHGVWLGLSWTALSVPLAVILVFVAPRAGWRRDRPAATDTSPQISRAISRGPER